MNLNKPVNYTTKEFCIMFAMLFVSIYLFQQAVKDIIYDADYFHGSTALLGSAGWVLMYLRYMKNINKKKNEQ